MLWSYLVRTRNEDFLIHADADIVFLGNAVEDVLLALQEGAILAGPRREYRLNTLGVDAVRGRADTVDTVCFGFRRKKVKQIYRRRPRSIIGSSRLDSALGRQVLDFFDPVSFSLMRHGDVAYLDSPEGGPSAHRESNSSFLSKFLAVRSAVGSGCAISKGRMSTSSGYSKYALESWALYRHHILGVETSEPPPVDPQLEQQLSTIDRSSWQRK